MVFTRRQSRAVSQQAQPVAPSTSPIADKLPSPPTHEPSLNRPVATTPARSKIPTTTATAAAASTVNLHQQVPQKTPSKATPAKPSTAAMHPQGHQKSTATPYEEARWLGFFQMQPQTEPRAPAAHKNDLVPNTPTPSRVTAKAPQTAQANSRVSDFQFTFRRESPERFASRGLELSEEARKVMEESRAEAARIRAELAAETASTASLRDPNYYARKIAKPKSRYSDAHKTAFGKMDSIANHPSAWRADPNRRPAPQAQAPYLRSIPSKSNLVAPGTKTLKRSHSKTDLNSAPSTPDVVHSVFVKPQGTTTSSVSSFAKRLKKAAGEDASTARPQEQEKTVDASRTPRTLSRMRSTLFTPTKASMAKTNEAKADETTGSRIPTVQRVKSSIGLRNPASAAKSRNIGPSNLMSPTKASMRRIQSVQDLKSAVQHTFSPTKLSQTQQRPTTPTLPAKASAPLPSVHSPGPNKVQKLEVDKVPSSPQVHSPTDGPELRRIKSILRTPQRLYSSDPSKLAAGTHQATPPHRAGLFDHVIPATAPVLRRVDKRVDFTASTLLKAARDEAKAASLEPEVIYPSLPGMETDGEITPLRRQTSTPGDFTFRADSRITFASATAAPTAPRSTTPTIRTVRTSDAHRAPISASSPIKRPHAIVESDEPLSDKENRAAPNINNNNGDTNDRPAKRARTGGVRQVSANVAQSVRNALRKARPGVGGTPRRQGGAAGISASRLALLATPKRR